MTEALPKPEVPANKHGLVFPEVLDSTMLHSFRACPRQSMWSYLRNIRTPGESIHLIAGAAFARGLEVTRRCYYEKGLPPDISLEYGLWALTKAYGEAEPPEKYKNKRWERTAGALEYYFDQFKLGGGGIEPYVLSGKPCIEFSFAIPIDIKHPETGNPLILAGRSDMIGLYNGSPFIVDEKTTGQLGDSWYKKWPLRAQCMNYAWAAQQYGFNIAGMIVRGIAIRETGYDKAESITYPQQKTALWLEQTIRDINRMLKAYHEGYFDMNLGDTCVAYGGCSFYTLCDKQDPEPFVKMYYEPHKWNPLEVVQ